MDLATYQELAKRTATHPDPNVDMYELMALGLIGETGEVVDLIKKHKFHGLPMDIEKLKKESGDLLWYFANALTLWGYTFAQLRQDCYCNSSAVLLGSHAGDMALVLHDGVDIDIESAAYLLAQLRSVVEPYGFTLEDAAAANIEKLQRRYPDGFDLDKARNHDSE